MVSAYAHNSHLLVKKGEKVKKGQVIATSGATGNVDVPQLHFELRRHASALDPERELPKL
jgi:murein DD-endopeptidase MepM/ murein hydrolase activator NlpD